MLFSKCYIDPDHMETMRAAFYKVCDALLLIPLPELIESASLR